jgi:phasin family protein
MITRPSQVLEMQRQQIDALSSLGLAIISAAEKLSDLHLSAGRRAIDKATETAQSLASIKDPKAAAEFTGICVQPPIEQMMSYSRNLVGIGNGVQAEISKVVEAQVAEGNRRATALVEYAARSAPAGSESAVSLMRTAVAAGNTAIDTVTKAARQATEWADANFAAAATATTTAIGTVKVKAARKAA